MRGAAENATLPAAAERRGIVAGSAVRALVVAILAFIMALVPLSLDYSPATSIVKVQKSEAQAINVPTAIPKAKEFLELCAGAAGMSVNDFQLTVGIGIAGTTGVNIFSDSVTYNADQTVQTINKLVTTLEWPDYDDLSDSQKTSWGSEENYNAAQFNAVLGCVGLAESRDVFYASGGDLDEGSVSIAQRIADLGNRWATGAILEASDVYAVFTNNTGLTYDGTAGSFGMSMTYNVIVDDLPAVVFKEANVDWTARGNNVRPETWWVGDANYNKDRYGPGVIGFRGSQSTTVLGDVVLNYRGGTSYNVVTIAGNSGGASPWVYRRDGNLDSNSASGGYGYIDFASSFVNRNYMYDYYVNGTKIEFGSVNPEQAMNETPEGTYAGETQPEGIGTDNISPETIYPDIVGTPTEDVTPPYVPPTPDERPQNPYNPSYPDNPANQSGTTEWKADTTENLEPAFNIRFDKLFPFCLIYDLDAFWKKFKSVMLDSGLGEQAVKDYTTLVIPGMQGVEGLQDGMSFDLTPLQDLGFAVKPFMFWLLLIFLIMGVVDFWQRILTGA